MIAVLEEGTEIRNIIETSGCGLCCEPGQYEEIADMVRWFASHADKEEMQQMGNKGRAYLVENLSKDVSVEKYKKVILES